MSLPKVRKYHFQLNNLKIKRSNISIIRENKRLEKNQMNQQNKITLVMKKNNTVKGKIILIIVIIFNY